MPCTLAAYRVLWRAWYGRGMAPGIHCKHMMPPHSPDTRWPFSVGSSCPPTQVVRRTQTPAHHAQLPSHVLQRYTLLPSKVQIHGHDMT